MLKFKRWTALAAALAAIAVVIVVVQLTLEPAPPAPAADPLPTSTGEGASASPSSGGEPKGPTAADFTGITQWINSQPLSIDELRGRVVLVDFWTYTCINCLRTLPYLRDWNDKYASKGLVVVGVHSPEFEFEKEESKVRDAIARERVTWSVAMDNDFKTWRAYRNRWWPHKFLIDRDGYVRYHHIGEGAYDETETKIRELLEEAGYDVSGIEPGGVVTNQGPGPSITRELYAGLGWSRGGYLGNDVEPVDGEPMAYSDPGQHEEGRFYLNGTWVVEPESVRPGQGGEGFDDYVAIQYTAGAVNVVVRPQGSGPVVALVTLDGEPVLESDRGDDIEVDDRGMTFFQVDAPRLYNLVRSDLIGTHDLRIRLNSPDFVLYTFTFGA